MAPSYTPTLNVFIKQKLYGRCLTEFTAPTWFVMSLQAAQAQVVVDSDLIQEVCKESGGVQREAGRWLWSARGEGRGREFRGEQVEGWSEECVTGGQMVVQEPLGADEGGRWTFTDGKMLLQRSLGQTHILINVDVKAETLFLMCQALS